MIVGGGEGEGWEFGKGFASSDALDAAVENGGLGDGFFELGFAFAPLLSESAFFALELVFQAEKGFHNGLDALTELQAAKVVVEELGFVGFVGLLHPLDGGGDQAVPERGGEAEGVGEFADPNAVVQTDAANALRGTGGDEDGEVGFGFTLVGFEFVGPIAGPIFRAFGLPENGAAMVALVGADRLKRIGTALSFLDFSDFVEGESGTQVSFQGDFEGFALQLHGALVGFLFEVGDLLLEIADDFVFLREMEAFGFGGAEGGVCGDFLAFLVESAGEFEFVSLLGFFEFALLFAEVEFEFFGGFAFRFFGCEPGFKIAELAGEFFFGLTCGLIDEFGAFDIEEAGGFGLEGLGAFFEGGLLGGERLLAGGEGCVGCGDALGEISFELLADPLGECLGEGEFGAARGAGDRGIGHG